MSVCVFIDMPYATNNFYKQFIQTAFTDACLKQSATTDSTKESPEGFLSFSVSECMLFQLLIIF